MKQFLSGWRLRKETDIWLNGYQQANPNNLQLESPSKLFIKPLFTHLVYVVIILVMAVLARRRLLNVSDSETSYFKAS